jgi:hypothetical protein
MKRTIKESLVNLPWLLIFLFGLATGCLMASLGLVMRLQDVIPGGTLSAWFGVSFYSGMGLTAGRIGWMLVLEGIFWIAALSALGAGNHWGWWSSAAASLISMIFFPGGTLAGILVLLAVGVRLIHGRLGKSTAKAKIPAKG